MVINWGVAAVTSHSWGIDVEQGAITYDSTALRYWSGTAADQSQLTAYWSPLVAVMSSPEVEHPRYVYGTIPSDIEEEPEDTEVLPRFVSLHDEIQAAWKQIEQTQDHSCGEDSDDQSLETEMTHFHGNAPSLYEELASAESPDGSSSEAASSWTYKRSPRKIPRCDLEDYDDLLDDEDENAARQEFYDIEGHVTILEEAGLSNSSPEQDQCDNILSLQQELALAQNIPDSEPTTESLDDVDGDYNDLIDDSESSISYDPFSFDEPRFDILDSYKVNPMRMAPPLADTLADAHAGILMNSGAGEGSAAEELSPEKTIVPTLYNGRPPSICTMEVPFIDSDEDDEGYEYPVTVKTKNVHFDDTVHEQYMKEYEDDVLSADRSPECYGNVRIYDNDPFDSISYDPSHVGSSHDNRVSEPPGIPPPPPLDECIDFSEGATSDRDKNSGSSKSQDKASCNASDKYEDNPDDAEDVICSELSNLPPSACESEMSAPIITQDYDFDGDDQFGCSPVKDNRDVTSKESSPTEGEMPPPRHSPNQLIPQQESGQCATETTGHSLRDCITPEISDSTLQNPFIEDADALNFPRECVVDSDVEEGVEEMMVEGVEEVDQSEPMEKEMVGPQGVKSHFIYAYSTDDSTPELTQSFCEEQNILNVPAGFEDSLHGEAAARLLMQSTEEGSGNIERSRTGTDSPLEMVSPLEEEKSLSEENSVEILPRSADDISLGNPEEADVLDCQSGAEEAMSPDRHPSPAEDITAEDPTSPSDALVPEHGFNLSDPPSPNPIKCPTDGLAHDRVLVSLEDLPSKLEEGPIGALSSDTLEPSTDAVAPDDALLADDLQSSADGLTPDVLEQPADGLTPDVLEQPADGLTPDVLERPADGLTPDVLEQSAEGLTPDVSEQSADGLTPDVSEESADGLTPDVLEQSANGLTPDVLEQSADGLTPDVIEQSADAPSSDRLHGYADALSADILAPDVLKQSADAPSPDVHHESVAALPADVMPIEVLDQSADEPSQDRVHESADALPADVLPADVLLADVHDTSADAPLPDRLHRSADAALFHRSTDALPPSVLHRSADGLSPDMPQFPADAHSPNLLLSPAEALSPDRLQSPLVDEAAASPGIPESLVDLDLPEVDRDSPYLRRSVIENESCEDDKDLVGVESEGGASGTVIDHVDDVTMTDSQERQPPDGHETPIDKEPSEAPEADLDLQDGCEADISGYSSAAFEDTIDSTTASCDADFSEYEPESESISEINKYAAQLSALEHDLHPYMYSPAEAEEAKRDVIADIHVDAEHVESSSHQELQVEFHAEYGADLSEDMILENAHGYTEPNHSDTSPDLLPPPPLSDSPEEHSPQDSQDSNNSRVVEIEDYESLESSSDARLVSLSEDACTDSMPPPPCEEEEYYENISEEVCTDGMPPPPADEEEEYYEYIEHDIEPNVSDNLEEICESSNMEASDIHDISQDYCITDEMDSELNTEGDIDERYPLGVHSESTNVISSSSDEVVPEVEEYMEGETSYCVAADGSALVEMEEDDEESWEILNPSEFLDMPDGMDTEAGGQDTENDVLDSEVDGLATDADGLDSCEEGFDSKAVELHTEADDLDSDVEGCDTDADKLDSSAMDTDAEDIDADVAMEKTEKEEKNVKVSNSNRNSYIKDEDADVVEPVLSRPHSMVSSTISDCTVLVDETDRRLSCEKYEEDANAYYEDIPSELLKAQEETMEDSEMSEDKSELDDSIDEISEDNEKLDSITDGGNMSDFEEFEKAYDDALTTLGELDKVLNMAGTSTPMPPPKPKMSTAAKMRAHFENQVRSHLNRAHSEDRYTLDNKKRNNSLTSDDECERKIHLELISHKRTSGEGSEGSMTKPGSSRYHWGGDQINMKDNREQGTSQMKHLRHPSTGHSYGANSVASYHSLPYTRVPNDKLTRSDKVANRDSCDYHPPRKHSTGKSKGAQRGNTGAMKNLFESIAKENCKNSTSEESNSRFHRDTKYRGMRSIRDKFEQCTRQNSVFDNEVDDPPESVITSDVITVAPVVHPGMDEDFDFDSLSDDQLFYELGKYENDPEMVAEFEDLLFVVENNLQASTEVETKISARGKDLFYVLVYIDGLVQDCSISSALALEIPQSCTNPSIPLCFMDVVHRLVIQLNDFINSLAPGRCDCDVKFMIFKLISRTDILSNSVEIAPRCTPQNLSDD